ncbi:MAG: hypothetical protein A3J24_01295, partial [Deltaproteobacteria bacterium RIFCSPLOWO2_02_FULL_53_8]
MKTVFIADAHLKGLDDPCQASVAGFIDGLSGIDALVILGDFFENWPGENVVALRQYEPVLSALVRLKEQGAEIVYVEGNHDFFMGGFFTQTLGAWVCPDAYEAAIDGRRIYAVHGDAISMTLIYRLWRGFLRSGLCRLIVAAMGPDIAWSLGIKLAHRSRTYSGNGMAVDAAIMSFAQTKIDAGVNIVVSAHSHQAGVHQIGGGVYANP